MEIEDVTANVAREQEQVDEIDREAAEAYSKKLQDSALRIWVFR